MEGADRWRRLAEVAIDLLHLHRHDGVLVDDPAGDPCVAGCYRCLLSYYNQPDHELIDRQDTGVLALLDQLSRCESPSLAGDPSGEDGKATWLTALASWGFPAPTTETIDGVAYPLCWPDRMVMAVGGAAPSSLVARCRDLGRDVVELRAGPDNVMPEALANLLGVTV